MVSFNNFIHYIAYTQKIMDEKDDIWIGMKRNSNGDFSWIRSQVQVPHEGPTKSNLWGEEPVYQSGKDCVVIWFSQSHSDFKRRFFARPCTNEYEGILCEKIP